jgi:CRP-like cAMP-binding protein
LPGLTTTQLNGLSTTNLNAVDVTRLSSNQVAGLSTTSVDNLTSTQISDLTATQVARLTSSQIGVLTSTELQGLTTTQANALTAAQLGSLTTTTLNDLSTTQVIKLLQQHLESGQVEQATELYSRCHEDVGYILMTRMPKDRPLQAKMAKMFFAAKDYEKAALVLEANEEYERAAELYERTDQFENAAEIWLKLDNINRAAHNLEKAGLWQRAAELYTDLNNYERAAYCFEKAVNLFLAGKYYYHIHKFEKSMELLQKIPEHEESYFEAAVLIGNILAMNGYLDMAIQKYQTVAKSVPLSVNSLTLYYNLAKLLEQNQQPAEALNTYRRVEEVFPHYRDVPARIAALSLQLRAPLLPREEEEDLRNQVTSLAEDVMPLSSERAGVVSVMEGFEFLKNTSLFERLSLAEITRLWNLCEVRSLGPGELLIEQDRPGEALYIVKWGTVIVQRVEGQSVTKVAELGPGSHVGEMSLVDMAPTSARVIAGASGAQVFEISRDQFDELLESDYRIALKIYKVFIETMASRLRKTTAELSSLKAQLASCQE